MYGKMRESGFTKIIPFICISAIWGSCLCFFHICLLQLLRAHRPEWLKLGGCQIAGIGILPGLPQGSETHIWILVCYVFVCYVVVFNLYAEYIMRNGGQEEVQAGIKIARRNISKLRYADNTTLMAESEEELKSLLMKVKEESGKAGLKLNIQKTKITTSGPITSWHIDGKIMETVTDFILGGSKITADGDCHHEIKRCFLLGRNL